jgi:hypothetical protein
MVMEDTGAMVTDVLDESEPMPLWGGILRRRFAGKTSSRLFADWSPRTKKLSSKIVVPPLPPLLLGPPRGPRYPVRL